VNQKLAERYHRLSPSQKKALRDKFADAPRAKDLIRFLDAHHGELFSMSEIVNGVYADRQVSFQTRQNRFFKLRQKMMDELEEFSTQTHGGGHLFPLEKVYYDCRDQMQANHFHLAKKGFVALIKECREKNVFELLHLALGSLLYCKQALNETTDLYRLLDEYDEAIMLNRDLEQMHACHRRMYAFASEKQYSRLEALMNEVRALATRHKQWPRFGYYFAFMDMTLGNAASGQDLHKLKLCVDRVEKQYRKYKHIPCVNYEAHYADIILFNIQMTRGILSFASGDAENAFKLISAAFDIADLTPGIRIRKTESLYINLITVANGTGRYEQAIRISEKLIEFHRSQKEERKRLGAYSTLAMIYTYSFDKIKCPDPEFLVGKLDEYIRSIRREGGKGIGDAYATKAVFLFMLRRFDQCNRIMRRKEVENIFHHHGLPLYTELLKLNSASPKSKVLDLKRKINQMIKETRSAELIQHHRRALNLLALL
jgi:tetratricopeptide (TPR) repeat protein